MHFEIMSLIARYTSQSSFVVLLGQVIWDVHILEMVVITPLLSQ